MFPMVTSSLRAIARRMRLPRLLAIALAMAALADSLAFAQSSNVSLGHVGDDPPPGNFADFPNYIWCVKGQHKAIRGERYPVMFAGISRSGQNEAGVVFLLPESNRTVTFERYATEGWPRPVFSPIYGPVTIPSLVVHSTAILGLNYIEFGASDSRGISSSRTKGCLVEVVDALPDVEVSGLRYDPATAGTARTVRLTIRNKITAPAPPLVSVPWSIVVSRRTSDPLSRAREIPIAAGVQNNVTAGSAFDVTARDEVREIAASDRVIGRADPANFIGENDEQRANNQMVIDRGAAAPPCEAGMEAVATQGGGRGCARPASFFSPRRCSSLYDVLIGRWIGACAGEALQCITDADCSSGNICPLSGSNNGICTPGHNP